VLAAVSEVGAILLAGAALMVERQSARAVASSLR
jgi:hypothetical protein